MFIKEFLYKMSFRMKRYITQEIKLPSGTPAAGTSYKSVLLTTQDHATALQKKYIEGKFACSLGYTPVFGYDRFAARHDRRTVSIPLFDMNTFDAPFFKD
jgi:hypothetical protein